MPVVAGCTYLACFQFSPTFRSQRRTGKTRKPP
uniref:Uncharacterized protein n=1 Tax=Anguilla anguilla TaxID=7936 RepID=A0A0E9QPF9_ANGAN